MSCASKFLSITVERRFTLNLRRVTMARSVLIAILTCSLLFSAESQFAHVSTQCLQCICVGSSQCDINIGCGPNTCGPYAITWGYWNDGGRPVLDGDSPSSDGAYMRCANDMACAERAVQNYMLRYGHDCNGDEEVTCYDFAAIHRSGSYNCGAQLDNDYVNKLMNCMAFYEIY